MIVLSAGHNPKRKGAQYKGFSEFPMTMNWAMCLQRELMALGEEVVIVEPGTLGQKVQEVNQFCKGFKVDLAIEIHFNGDPGHAGKGSETLYCPGSKKGEDWAELIQNGLGLVMPPDRGVKEGWYHSPTKGKVRNYFLYHTRCPAVIIEPEFIHHRVAIENRMEVTCTVLAVAIVLALEEDRKHSD